MPENAIIISMSKRERGTHPIVPKDKLGITIDVPDDTAQEPTVDDSHMPTADMPQDSGRAPLGVVIDRKKQEREQEDTRIQPEMPPPPPPRPEMDDPSRTQKKPDGPRRGVEIVDLNILDD